MKGQRFVFVTLHRPSNVDDPHTLRELLETLAGIGREAPVVFPVHPRTRARIADLGWQPPDGSVRLLEPLPYLETLSLVLEASLVLTDSGGLQEETSYLGIPCLTARPNTERPITVTQGTNRLVPSRREPILAAAHEAWRTGRRPRGSIERWDGRTAERIVEVLCDGAEYR